MTETARYHGAFFSLLLEKLEAPVALQRIRTAGSGYYLIDEAIAVCLKWSSKRTGPWTFNFATSHRQTLQQLQRTYGEVFVCLICGRDGIAGLSFEEVTQVLVSGSEEQQCISVRRRLRSMYEIGGPDGKFGSRVGRQTVFERLVRTIGNGDPK